jgi:hypothetical protein
MFLMYIRFNGVFNFLGGNMESRIVVVLNSDLVKAAKIYAIKHDITLKDLVQEHLSKGIGFDLKGDPKPEKTIPEHF